MTVTSATYSPEDNKIRLYASARLDRETYNRVSAAGFKWAPKQSLFYTPSWSPAAEDIALELAGEIGDEDTTLVERAEQRAERFEDYSDKRLSEAESARAAVHKIAEHIPFGQPILVGHHSERRARKDAEKIESGMRRAVNLWKTSTYWQDRAEGALAHAKYLESKDVRARRIKKLESELRGYERHREETAVKLALWSKEGLTHQQAVAIANRTGCLATMPRKEGDRPDFNQRPSLWDALVNNYPTLYAPRTLEEVIEHAKKIYQPSGNTARWIEHLNNRLAYERAMLQEQGGLVSDRFGLKIGGKVMHTRSHDWFTITKLNRDLAGGVCSVTTNARDWRRVTKVEEITDYRDPTEEEVKATKEATKAPPLCNYPREDFITITKAEWGKLRSESKSQGTPRNIIAETETAGRHRVRLAMGVYFRERLAPKIAAAKAKAQAEGRYFCDTNITHVFHFVYISDEKRKDPPKPSKEEAKLPAPEHDWDRALESAEESSARRAKYDEQRRIEEEAEKPFADLEASLKGGVKVVSAPQLFPTPDGIAERMAEMAELEVWHKVLEPSAGTGNIWKHLSGKRTAVELSERLADGMREKCTPGDWGVASGDFLEKSAEEINGPFDRIVMNPPFSNSADVRHIKHALTMLRPGGRLVAICANGPRQQEALRHLASSWEVLPSGTFAGTGVSSVLLVIDKPAEAAEARAA